MRNGNRFLTISTEAESINSGIVDGGDDIQMDLLESHEDSNEVKELVDASALALDVMSDTMSDISDMEEALEQPQNIDATSVMLAEQSLENHMRRLGGDRDDFGIYLGVISRESANTSPVQSMTLSLEASSGFFSNLWEKIKAIFRRIMLWAKKLKVKMTTNLSRLEAKSIKLSDKLTKKSSSVKNEFTEEQITKTKKRFLANCINFDGAETVNLVDMFNKFGYQEIKSTPVIFKGLVKDIGIITKEAHTKAIETASTNDIPKVDDGLYNKMASLVNTVEKASVFKKIEKTNMVKLFGVAEESYDTSVFAVEGSKVHTIVYNSTVRITDKEDIQMSIETKALSSEYVDKVKLIGYNKLVDVKKATSNLILSAKNMKKFSEDTFKILDDLDKVIKENDKILAKKTTYKGYYSKIISTTLGLVQKVGVKGFTDLIMANYNNIASSYVGLAYCANNFDNA